jgi:DNA-binding MarR family transcriptional regulator
MEPLIALSIIAFILLIVVIAYNEGKRQGAKQAQSTDQSERKNRNKQSILILLEQHGSLSNAEIREHLDVSPRTVVNYMDELEQDGKVEQVGYIGQGVVYRLK